jgi:hypothetical protein
MSARSHIVGVSACLAAAIALSGCAAETQIVLASSVPPLQRELLDVRIASVTIEGTRMHEALGKLSEQIRNQSGGKLVFEYNMGLELEKHNPKLSIHAKDIPLRTLLDDMCRQSGWTYITRTPGLLPPGIYFLARYE